LRLPGCRTEEEYQAANKAAAEAGWREEFHRRLGACLQAAESGEEMESRASALDRWLAEELPRLWPEMPSWTWELEVWAGEPGIREGGETLLAWGGLGKAVVPG